MPLRKAQQALHSSAMSSDQARYSSMLLKRLCLFWYSCQLHNLVLKNPGKRCSFIEHSSSGRPGAT
jgi:hypothetical protein